MATLTLSSSETADSTVYVVSAPRLINLDSATSHGLIPPILGLTDLLPPIGFGRPILPRGFWSGRSRCMGTPSWGMKTWYESGLRHSVSVCPFLRYYRSGLRASCMCHRMIYPQIGRYH